MEERRQGKGWELVARGWDPKSDCRDSQNVGSDRVQVSARVASVGKWRERSRRQERWGVGGGGGGGAEGQCC